MEAPVIPPATSTPTGPKFQRSVIVLLAFVALLLGYFVYQKYAPPQFQLSLRGGQRTFPDYERPEDALDAPPDDAPAAARENFETLVRQTAEATREIKLRDCVPTPLIAKLFVNETVTFRNMDTRVRTVEFGHRTYDIAVGGTVEVPGADFTRGPAIYGYGCGGDAAGIIWVQAAQ